MKSKPKSSNQTLKTSFKAPLIQQMPYKAQPATQRQKAKVKSNLEKGFA